AGGPRRDRRALARGGRGAHRERARDAGGAPRGVLALAAMATVALPLRRNALSGSALATGLALGVVGLVLSWFGAAWDVSWHRALGRETFWSPPHLFLYGGVICWGLASLVATVTAMAGRPARSAELRVGPVHAELGLALVGLGALAVIGSAPFGELWHRTLGSDDDLWRPPHLPAAGGSTAFALVPYAVLDEAGWRPPASPPLVLAGALALDLLRARGGRWAHPVALGAAFSLAFVAAETLRVGFIAPPAAPIVSGPGVDPRLSGLFFQYYAQTVARPWLSLWPAGPVRRVFRPAPTSLRF